MSTERVDRILMAAYGCFVRHGVRRTTMDDIATEAGMSRTAVYQYVRNKEDAFRRLAQQLHDEGIAAARAAATAPGPLPLRLVAILTPKLELVQRIWRDSPAHAAELLGATTELGADLDAAFTTTMRGLLAEALTSAETAGEIQLHIADADEVADLALALTRGIEADMTDPDVPRQRLRTGLTLLVAGLSNPGGTP